MTTVNEILPQPEECKPTVLDSPRFFDDSPLSEWSVTEPKDKAGLSRSIGASKQAVNLAPLWHGDESLNSWPDPQSDGEPISVELVRGANGPSDNSWTVVIDGLRCHPKMVQGSLGETVYKCQLPPGVNPRKHLDRDTQVRPVIVGVRLEEEAVAPLEVLLETLQVIRTDEMESQPADEPIVTSTSQIEMIPYRVSNAASNVVKLPYPYISPAQSVLGIVSFEQVKRWEEEQRAVFQYNIYAGVTNIANKTMFAQAMDAYNTNNAFNTAIRALKPVAAAFDAKTRMGQSAELIQLAASKLSDVKRPILPNTIRQRRGSDKPKTQDETILIGGNKRSAPKELTYMFKNLTTLCEQSIGVYDATRKDLMTEDSTSTYGIQYKDLPDVKTSASLRYRLVAMRKKLQYESNNKIRALFDALMSTKVYPETTLLLGKQKWLKNQLADMTTDAKGVVVDGVIDGIRNFRMRDVRRKYTTVVAGVPSNDSIEKNEVKITLVEESERESVEKEVRNTRNDLLQQEEEHAQKGQTPYMFSYRRLGIDSRKKTTVKTVIRVRLVDFKNGPILFEFEASEEDGIVANAVYSGHVDDVLDMEEAADGFVDCMFSFYTQTEGFRASVVSTFDTVVQGFNNLTYSMLASPKGRKVGRKYVPSDVTGVLKYFFVDELRGKLDDIDKDFKLDFGALEDRVAELKIMVRDTLPVWPRPVNLSQEDILALGQVDDDSEDETDNDVEPDSPGKKFNQKTDDAKKLYEDGLRSQESANILKDDTVKNLAEQRKLQKIIQLEAQRLSLRPDLKVQEEEQEAIQNIDMIISKGELSDEDKIAVLEKLENLGVMQQRVKEYVANFDQVETRQEFQAYVANTQMVKRTLPQILLPRNVIKFSFKSPEQPEPPFAVARIKILPIVRAQEPGTSKTKKVLKTLTTVAAAYMAVTLATGFLAIGAGAVAAAGGITSGSTIVSLTAIASTYGIRLGFASSVLVDAINRAFNGLVYNIAFQCYAFERNRWASNAARRELYEKSQRTLRMVPVVSSITSARSAMEVGTKRMTKFLERLGIKRNIVLSTIYNADTNKRFRFYEYYQPSYSQITALRNVAEIHHSSDWNAVPDGNAMNVFPPIHVLDCIYEAQILRGVPIDNAVAFAVGNAPGPTTPAYIYAREAFKDIMLAILRSRQTLKGENLMGTAAQTALNLVTDAKELITSAYGPNAGITLVDGDDAIWTCFAGGVVARLSLRHFEVFAQSERLRLQTDSGKSTLLNTVEFWKRPRRVMIDEFAAALLQEARIALKEESTYHYTPTFDPRTVSIESTRVFARVMAMASAENKNILCMVVASSAIHNLWFSSTESNKDLTKRVREYCLQEQASAMYFKDQNDFQKPSLKQTAEQRDASWASRLLDAPECRSMIMGQSDPTDTIVDKLVKLTVGEDVPSDKKAVYYCPMGARVEAIPGKVPFSVDGMSKRVVWLEVLRDNAFHVKNCLTAIDRKTSDAHFIHAYQLSPYDTSTSNTHVTGLSRHPLTISVESNRSMKSKKITVGLSEHIDARFPLSALSDVYKDDIVSYMIALETLDDQHRVIRTSVEAMRVMAYNSERLLNVLSLLSALKDEQDQVSIALPTSKDATALSIALSMFTIDTGISSSALDMYVVYDESEERAMATRNLQRVHDFANNAFLSGCKVATLAEVCMCSLW